MITLEQIQSFFPPYLKTHPAHQQYLIKEYLQLMILDFLSNSSYVRHLTFIGGTNLRLVKGIDRFSEDLDFDCKSMSQKDFTVMTDAVLVFLERNGFQVETKDKENPKLTAYRRNIYFPELLFELGLSGHKEKRFLIKVESQDQNYDYQPAIVNIKGCGFFFPFPVPTDPILCSMKLSALLSRSKGRDFYDAIFLLSLTQPDYTFLEKKHNISNIDELKEALINMLSKVNLEQKSKDFEHLLFNKNNTNKILGFKDFINQL